MLRGLPLAHIAPDVDSEAARNISTGAKGLLPAVVPHLRGTAAAWAVDKVGYPGPKLFVSEDEDWGIVQIVIFRTWQRSSGWDPAPRGFPET